MASGRSNIGAASRRTRLETIPGHEPFKRVHHQLDGHTPTLEWRTHGTSCESLRAMNRGRRRPFVEAALRGRASRARGHFAGCLDVVTARKGLGCSP